MSEKYEPTEADMQSYVPGQWYCLFVLGGFTMFGWYVCPLGYNQHRFRDVAHLRNAGGLDLSDICRGKTSAQLKFANPFPGDWDGSPLHKTTCEPMPWAKSKRGRK